MDKLLFAVARTAILLLQALPLPWVARLGRAGGALAYRLDVRHRRVALANLKMCFGHEMSPAEIRTIARENFRRIGENYASAIRTAAMDWQELQPHVEFVSDPMTFALTPDGQPRSLVAAIGHFGNFELYARVGQYYPGLRPATTYRALRQPSLNRLLRSLRERSGCLYFERRTDSAALRAAMSRPGTSLGLLADQNAGRAGAQIPFLGHDCSTSVAPAVFALRYHCPLRTAICHRVGLARWRIEVGPEIPTRENGRPRKTEAIMRDVNRAFEAAVRRDPANWFWVHNRWKRRNPKPKASIPKPQALQSAGQGAQSGAEGPVDTEEE
jgi:KDO2-lipid IV(A) lauroyltransferase